MNIVLYSTHCPRCTILEKKLCEKQIEYEEITDSGLMISIGLTNVPVLEVDGNKMEFKEANKWINEYK